MQFKSKIKMIFLFKHFFNLVIEMEIRIYVNKINWSPSLKKIFFQALENKSLDIFMQCIKSDPISMITDKFWNIILCDIELTRCVLSSLYDNFKDHLTIKILHIYSIQYRLFELQQGISESSSKLSQLAHLITSYDIHPTWESILLSSHSNSMIDILLPLMNEPMPEKILHDFYESPTENEHMLYYYFKDYVFKQMLLHGIELSARVVEKLVFYNNNILYLIPYLLDSLSLQESAIIGTIHGEDVTSLKILLDYGFKVTKKCIDISLTSENKNEDEDEDSCISVLLQHAESSIQSK